MVLEMLLDAPVEVSVVDYVQVEPLPDENDNALPLHIYIFKARGRYLLLNFFTTDTHSFFMRRTRKKPEEWTEQYKKRIRNSSEGELSEMDIPTLWREAKRKKWF